MDLEALLLGIEPIVALGVGITALALGPVMTSLGQSETGKSLTESGRDLTKNGIKWGLESFDKVQGSIAEVGETWNDLLAEAQAEVKASKNSKTPASPQEVSISE